MQCDIVQMCRDKRLCSSQTQVVLYTLEIYYIINALDVHGSVHHSTNHIEITKNMQPSIRFYYFNIY
jgi:hypothetical protein